MTKRLNKRERTAARLGAIQKAIVTVHPPARVGAYVLGGSTSKVLAVNPTKRERFNTYYNMYRMHPIVRAAIDKIAKIAVKNGYRLVPENATKEISPSNIETLKRFFRESNIKQLLRSTYIDIMIFGESYWLIVGANAGRPSKAMRLMPTYIDPVITDGIQTGWRYSQSGTDDQNAIYYTDSEVLYFHVDDPMSDIHGLSLLTSLEHTVASDLYAMTFNERFFENSASSGMILSMKSSSQEEINRNREWLEQNYVGIDHVHRPMILEGDIDVKKSIGTPQEMQFIEGRRFNRQEILSVLDIDPTKLGINENANRSVSAEADNSFREEGVGGIQTIVEEEISNALIYRLFGFDNILFEQEEASFRDRINLMKQLVTGEQHAIFSVNENRKELGLPPVDGGDVYLLQSAAGIIPLDRVTDFADKMIQSEQMPSKTVGGIGTGSTQDKTADPNQPK